VLSLFLCGNILQYNYPLQADAQTSTRTAIRCFLRFVQGLKMFHVTVLYTWVSLMILAARFTSLCLHPCTNLSRNLHHRSSLPLQVKTCIWVQQNFSPQRVFPLNSVMYVEIMFRSLLQHICTVTNILRSTLTIKLLSLWTKELNWHLAFIWNGEGYSRHSVSFQITAVVVVIYVFQLWSAVM